MPDLQETSDRLRAKYGRTFFQRGAALNWSWNVNGQPYGPGQEATIQTCSQSFGSSTPITFNNPKTGPVGTFVPKGDSLHQQCSYIVSALLKPAGMQVGVYDHVGQLDIRMMDVRPYVALALKEQKTSPPALPQKKAEAPL